jgi:polyprenyl-phospho-N-acetylgalactosaminyl synthase
MCNQSKPSDVFVVIPAYNEEATIRTVVAGVLAAGYQVVVVDDGSSQDLGAALHNLPIHYLRHGVNLGQGAALQTGIHYALEQQANFVVTFDADAQHQASDIERMLLAMQQSSADVVLGSRFMQSSTAHIPFTRKLLLQAARVVNFLFTGLYLTDAHNGLRLLNRKAAEFIFLKENRMAHATEILSQINALGLKYIEAPVHISYSAYSRQKGQTAWGGFRILIDLLLAKLFQ